MPRSFRSLLLAISLVAGVSGAAAQRRPNIVFILSDDHAAHALSAYRPHLRYGAQLIETPNLDRLAASGMLFANAFVTNSICAPARAAVLTGQYGHLSGVMTNREPLHPTHTTFPKLMRDAGYATALFGKWHLKAEPAGFDHYEILTGQGPYYNPPLHSATDTVRHTGYTPDVTTDRALAWLAARPDTAQPFLMLLHFNAPHRFWDPGPQQMAMLRDTVIAEPATFWDDGAGRAFRTRDPEMTIALDMVPRDLKLEDPLGLTPEQQAQWDAGYARENAALRAAGLTGDALTRWKYQRYITDYLRVVAGVDANVGRVMDALARSGLDEETIVIYTSDQGFFLGDHGWFDKRWMYEESLRTPLLVRWPGATRAGAVNRDLVMNLDLAETVLGMAGVAAPASMQGESLVPLLRGQTPSDWRDAIYYQYFEYPGWHMVRRHYGVRTSRYKLIHYYEVDAWELFDLDRDPNEMRSLYGDAEYAPVVGELKTRLARLRSQYAVPAQDPVPYERWEAPEGYRRTPD
jgi:arylsulfatase A-like enzyme